MDDNTLVRLLQENLVDINEQINDNPTCIKVKGNSWGTLSNFSAVIGKPKARKSFLVMMALASAVSRKQQHITVNFLKDYDTVLYFDTEQSKFHIHRSIQRISGMAGKHPINLVTYGLRKFDPPTRLALINKAIENTPDIGLLVIDGIRDLVTSINDEEQATMITSKLLKWSEEKNIHIIVVLHQNKGDNNARGHVGSEIVNKAETVISVTKEGDISAVKCDYSRDMEFEPFAFRVSPEGLPEILDDYVLKVNEKKTPEIKDLPADTHQFILNHSYHINPNPRYTELTTYIQSALKSLNQPAGKNRAKDFITYYISTGKIKKDESVKRYPPYLLIQSV